MSTNKKSLINSQIVIVLYLLAAAVSAIEAMAQFGKGGFSNPWVYFMAVIFIFSAGMYFVKKKQRFNKDQ